MLIFVDAGYVGKFISRYEYPYQLKEKYFWFSAFDPIKCAIVKQDSEDTALKVYAFSHENAKSINDKSEQFLLKAMQEIPDYVGKNFLIYLPTNAILVDLTSGKEYGKFTMHRPPMVGNFKEFLAAYISEENKTMFARLENSEKLLSTIIYKAEADSLLSASKYSLQEYGCGVVYWLANKLNSTSTKKETYIKPEELVQPVRKINEELKLVEGLDRIIIKPRPVVNSVVETAVKQTLLPEYSTSPEPLIKLSEIIDAKALIHRGTRLYNKPLELDVVIGQPKISKVFIEYGNLVFTTKEVQYITEDVVKKLKDSLGIPILIRVILREEL